MPTYEYECRSCGHRMEVIHSMTADGPSACERCAGPLRRVLYPTGIIFKGAGFYKTDSRAAGTGASSEGTGKPTGASSPPSDGGKADAGSGPSPAGGTTTTKSATDSTGA